MTEETNKNSQQASDNTRDKTASQQVSKQDPDDLPDSERDREHLKPETTIINLPDVSDIPGQEHIHVPSLGELSDTTISSDDEEGEDVFDDKNTRDR